jgi:TolA-binding protein
VVQPPRTPEVALNEGHAALARRDYAAAIAAAREVLTTGHGPRTVDAQLLLAQAEAGQRNFQQAALDYYDTYNRARTGGHAPEALLGVATSLTELNDKPAACQALDRLRTEFPDPRPDLRAQEVAARSRAGCR